MAWAEPNYSRSKVDKAGWAIVDPIVSNADLEEAYLVVNNWRSCHSYPLNAFQNTLRGRAAKFGSDYIIAQRIKRLESLSGKLVRSETKSLQLSQMQDIGGCRAVMKNVEQVKQLHHHYITSATRHKLKTEKDYIIHPKSDGYRGIHLVYQYKGQGTGAAYDKLRIEVQIRSAQQHAWATAVEAVSIFTDQALKWRSGKEEWRRFFALMSSAIAMTEGSNPVPETPETAEGLRRELLDLEGTLKAQGVLQMYQASIKYAGQAKGAKYLLLSLDPEERKISIDRFTASLSQEANRRYLEAERGLPSNTSKQIVLVSVDSISKLQKAYPNYFMDTTLFANIVSSVLNGYLGKAVA